jgi:hypothetical protein
MIKYLKEIVSCTTFNDNFFWFCLFLVGIDLDVWKMVDGGDTFGWTVMLIVDVVLTFYFYKRMKKFPEFVKLMDSKETIKDVI